MGRITVDGKWKTNIEQLGMAWNRDPCLRLPIVPVNYFIIPFRSAICSLSAFKSLEIFEIFLMQIRGGYFGKIDFSIGDNTQR